MTPTSGVDGGGVRSLDGAAARRWVTVWFTRKNYPKHRALDPSGLPSTFDEWLANAGYEVTPAGPALLRVVIDPARFATWCRAASCQPDASARTVFARIVAEAAKRRAWWPNHSVNGKARGTQGNRVKADLLSSPGAKRRGNLHRSA
jgi:hypothetical protein